MTGARSKQTARRQTGSSQLRKRRCASGTRLGAELEEADDDNTEEQEAEADEEGEAVASKDAMPEEEEPADQVLQASEANHQEERGTRSGEEDAENDKE